MDERVCWKSAIEDLLSNGEIHMMVSAIQPDPLSRSKDCKERSAMVEAHNMGAGHKIYMPNYAEIQFLVCVGIAA